MILVCVCHFPHIRMDRQLPTLFRNISRYFMFTRELNCWTAGITKRHRKIYERNYPTVLVFPNGSSINVKYSEPRQIIRLPLDLSQLSEAERKRILERRTPITKIKIEDEIEDDYDEDRYINYGKNRQ